MSKIFDLTVKEALALLEKNEIKIIEHGEYGAYTQYALPVMRAIEHKYLIDDQFKSELDSIAKEGKRYSDKKIEVSEVLLEYIFEQGFSEGQKAGAADTTKIYESRLRYMKEFYSQFVSATFPWERGGNSSEHCSSNKEH